MAESQNQTSEVADYELLKAPEEPPRRPYPGRKAGLWIVVAGLIAATAIAAYIVFGGRQRSASTAPGRVEVREQPVRPLGGDAAPIDVPPLDQTDPLVRELVKQITSHPRVAAWLATDGLIRNFAVVVANIAEGRTPAVHLRMLRPELSFHVIERGGSLSIDPRSYQRYDGLAAAAASVDPAGAARVYATLRPRIEEAYRDLGHPETPFDRTLERSIVLLLNTPTVHDPVHVRPQGGIGYVFADPDLEELSAPQKQLLRTGTGNVRTIQSSLRAIALALGIPAERLPVPTT